MDSLTVRVEGVRQLRRELREAGDDLEDLKAAHRKAARPVEQAAVANTPKRSGRAARTVRTLASKTKARIAGGGARAPHFGPLEGGHGYRSAPRPQGGYMVPQAPIHRAIASQGRRVVAVYRREVDRIARDVRSRPRP